MADLTAADRDFLSLPWRYVEANTAALKVAHPGAREADRPSPFIASGGATAVLVNIHALLSDENLVLEAVVDGIIPISLAGKPPTLTLYAARFGLEAGRAMLVVSVKHEWSRERTTLTLWG